MAAHPLPPIPPLVPTLAARRRYFSEPTIRMIGVLEEIGLTDVIQLLSISRKSGVLVVCDDLDEGRMYFRHGQIYYATLGVSPPVAPCEAIYRMLSWTAGTFALEPGDDRLMPDEIEDSTEQLILEGMRRIDERRRAESRAPIELDARDVETVEAGEADEAEVETDEAPSPLAWLPVLAAPALPFRRPPRLARSAAIAAAVLMTFCGVLGGRQMLGRPANAVTHDVTIRSHHRFQERTVAPVAAVAPTPAPPADPEVSTRKTRRVRLVAVRTPAPQAALPLDQLLVEPPAAPVGDAPGYLVANSHPLARVIIDGKDTGKMTPVSPRQKIPLAPGKHVVTFAASDRKYNFDIVVRTGENLVLIRQLDDSP